MPSEYLEDNSHRRYNALRGTWVLVSPHRTKRPWQGQQESPSTNTLPEHDAACYLCPGNPRAAGDVNPDYKETFVFPNDYAAVKESQPEYNPGEDEDDKTSLLLASPVTGKCFVICFNPLHNLTLADMSPAQIVPIIKTWTQLYAAHLTPSDPNFSFLPASSPIAQPTQQYRYFQIFENKGAAMGCSNPHPHGQIWTTSSLPEEPATEIAAMRKYRQEHKDACLLCDYVELEIKKQERIVFQNEHWLAVVPWWATWPFEILLLAKRCVACLPELTADMQTTFAEALSQVAKRYDNLFQTSFPYSMGIHQAPLYHPRSGVEGEEEPVHLHVHFYPPLLRSATVRKFLVGFEMLGEPQRDITPEQAAGRLRALDGTKTYREELKL